MTRNQLKIFAYFCMVIDHVGAIFFKDVLILRIIGRLAFPIFAFFVAESVYYTTNKKRYLLRLFILALISEPIYDITFSFDFLSIQYQSVFVTLLCGALVCYLVGTLKPKFGYWAYIVAIPIGMLAEFLKSDYGYYGVFIIVAFYLMRDIQFYDRFKIKQIVVIWIMSMASVLAVVRGTLYVQHYAICSGLFLPPLKPCDKKMSKCWYLFYPAHLLILYILKKLLFAY